MARWLALLLVSGLAAAPGRAGDRGKQEKPREEAAQQPQQEQEPPEEDETVARKEYGFNPLQASKELQIGNFYYRKGSYRAAAQRYREATRWNAGYAEAWLRLGEASEKLRDSKTAREAFEKYLELEPEGKEAGRLRRKLRANQ